MKVLLSGIFCVLFQLFSYGAELNSDLSFYAPFNEDCTPSIARGSSSFSEKNAQVVPGKVGNSVKLSSKLKDVALEQTIAVPFVPGSGLEVTVTTTSLLDAPHPLVTV